MAARKPIGEKEAPNSIIAHHENHLNQVELGATSWRIAAAKVENNVRHADRLTGAGPRESGNRHRRTVPFTCLAFFANAASLVDGIVIVAVGVVFFAIVEVGKPSRPWFAGAS